MLLLLLFGAGVSGPPPVIPDIPGRLTIYVGGRSPRA